MNIPFRILVAAPLLAALQAWAGPTDRFSIACPGERLPSHADIARVFDEHNLGKVSQLRQRALNFARRECRAGVTHVEFVAAPALRPTGTIALTGY
jgi:hypothetical protein